MNKLNNIFKRQSTFLWLKVDIEQLSKSLFIIFYTVKKYMSFRISQKTKKQRKSKENQNKQTAFQNIDTMKTRIGRQQKENFTNQSIQQKHNQLQNHQKLELTQKLVQNCRQNISKIKADQTNLSDKLQILPTQCFLCEETISQSHPINTMFKCNHRNSLCIDCLVTRMKTQMSELKIVKCPLQICEAPLDASTDVFKQLPQILQQQYLQIHNSCAIQLNAAPVVQQINSVSKKISDTKVSVNNSDIRNEEKLTNESQIKKQNTQVITIGSCKQIVYFIQKVCLTILLGLLLLLIIILAISWACLLVAGVLIAVLYFWGHACLFESQQDLECKSFGYFIQVIQNMKDWVVYKFTQIWK